MFTRGLPCMAAAHPGSLGLAKQLEDVAVGVGVQRFNYLGFVLDRYEAFSVPSHWGTDRMLSYTF